MANLKMPDREMGSRRFMKFMALAGMDRRQALGQLLLFWDGTRAAKLEFVGRAITLTQLDGDAAERTRTFDALVAAGYLKAVPGDAEVWVIDGNRRAIAYTESLRARARVGAAKLHSKPAAKKTKRRPAATNAALVASPDTQAPPQIQNPSEFQMACRATWLSYAQAYEQKTCQLPIRNAKLNAQIQQIVKRLGHDDAPKAIRFYVEQVTDKFIIESLWSLDLFLRRAEAYATQCKMGRPLHAQQAQGMAASAAYYAQQSALLNDL